MDEEVFEKAKDENMSLEEAIELQSIVDETGLDPERALRVKEFAEEEGLDIDEAAELEELLD